MRGIYPSIPKILPDRPFSNRARDRQAFLLSSDTRLR
jgi:hypothetical protein